LVTPRNTPLPHMCYPAEVGRSKSDGTGVIKEFRLKKFDTHVPPFQITQGDRNRRVSICHL